MIFDTFQISIYADCEARNFYLEIILYLKPFLQNNLHNDANCDINVIFIIDNTGYTFIDAYLAGETFEEICRTGRWRGVPKGLVASGPRAKRRRVTVQRAPPTRSRVCARVAKRAPRLSSLCKEAIQITPRLPRAPSSRAQINADRASNWPPGPPLRSSKHWPRISSSFKFFPKTVVLKKPSTGYDAVRSIQGSSFWYKLYSFAIA